VKEELLRRTSSFPGISVRPSNTAAMLEILNMLHFARFKDAALVGDEIHVTGPRKRRLIVTEYGDAYAVRAATDDRSAARVCEDPIDVIDEIKGWGD
jgi:hypothetical protein